MEVHERFMKMSTTTMQVINHFIPDDKNRASKICELMMIYNLKISQNRFDLKTLETFRKMICYVYQSLMRSRNMNEPFKCEGRLYTNLKILLINNKEYLKKKEFSVLYDIAVLQLFYSAEIFFELAFQDVWISKELSSITENVELAIRVIECFADSYNLRSYHRIRPDDPVKLEIESTRFLSIIRLWLKKEEDFDWKLLASLLKKLTVTFGPHKIVVPLWQDFLGSLKILPPFTGKEFSEITDIEKKIAVLSVMADVFFPSDNKKVEEFHYDQCLQNEFWCILNRGLIDKDLQQRKRALYLMKRALDFVEIHQSEIIRRLSRLQQSAMPFVCTKSENRPSSPEEIKKIFFMILEVLEEKQKHLVLPALSHLQTLVKVQADHKHCCDFFNPIWLRCVYRRIVQHDNDSVKILGLQEILKADPQIFSDNEFLLFFVDSLNNTFLYEYNDEDGKPLIVKELEAIFLRWEQKKITLINAFVRTLPLVSWGPVPIYWLLQALLAVTEQCKIVTNVWRDLELHSVNDLIQKSLMTHNVHLRALSQILIIRTFIAYASLPASPSQLESIFNILCSFPDNHKLQPGSEEWYKITNHLTKIIQPSDAVQYVTQRCEKMFELSQNLKTLALTVHLLADAGRIFVDKSCPTEEAFWHLFQNLIGADVRPYADKDVILKVIEFSGHLISPISHDGRPLSRTKIDKLMTPYIDAIFKIVCKSLEGKTQSQYDEYIFVIDALLKRATHEVVLYRAKEEFQHIKEKCISIINDPATYSRTQWSYAIKMLQTCYQSGAVESKGESEFAYIPSLLRYFRTEMVYNEREQKGAEVNESSKEKFGSDCPEIIAYLLYKYCLSSSSNPWSIHDNWLENLGALVQIGNEDVIGSVIAILRIELERNENIAVWDLEIMNCIIRTSWRITFRVKKTPATVRNISVLSGLITSEAFLKLEGSKKNLFEYLDQIMQEGEKTPLLKRILLDSTTNRDMIFSHKAFISCLLHGSVPRRDQRIERTAILHGQRLCKDCTSSLSDANIDAAVRVKAIACLLSLRDKPEVQENILNNLLEILKQNKNKRYFDNSHLHRLKQKVMQTLLIQEPLLNESQRQRLHDALCDLLIAESNQRSVRLIHEWLIVRLHLKNADMRETIWKLFDVAAEKRPGSIVSLTSIVFHVARSLIAETQMEYIGKAILELLTNSMAQQFSVRLYSQTILVDLYKILPEDSSEAATHKLLFECMEESLRRGNMMKNSERILDDFYFTVFDPELDFDFETIYYSLPRLTRVSADELIQAEAFEKISFPEEGGIRCFGRGLLHKAKMFPQISKPTGELETSADSTVALGDIQKKIIPWKNMVPFYDDLSENTKARLLQRKMQDDRAGIIVVASLIDRPPNLGGLARTCEIFGVKELVIGSLKYAEDREFQTLSVSAEKWITITEVKPHLLQKYLLEKHHEGWQLVGAEQTANSTYLHRMKFPKKTVLLLGNEKDGIPVDLIHLMDTCVEIPQCGVVRSLNVHVTGALCIWEYAQQHIFT